MKTPSGCFVLLAILVLAANFVASKTVQEPMSGQVQARSSLNGLPYTGLNKRLAAGPNSVGPASSPLSMGEEEVSVWDSKSAKDGHGDGSCISAEMCRKMKMLCFKKCVGKDGGNVDGEHVPGAKCIVKCSKCVPNC